MIENKKENLLNYALSIGSIFLFIYLLKSRKMNKFVTKIQFSKNDMNTVFISTFIKEYQSKSSSLVILNDINGLMISDLLNSRNYKIYYESENYQENYLYPILMGCSFSYENEVNLKNLNNSKKPKAR